ncbi:MAG: cell division protein ZapA [Rickettsiales bacterium]|nr:cell division protein ZapA [Rickettsiales bacterium]
MGKMNVTIYGREYALACDDGQEAHLGKLVQMINDRAQQLVSEMGRASESTMLVYTALMMADEILEVQSSADVSKKELRALSKGDAGAASQARIEEMESAMADSMHHFADRIEKIAEKLEAA